MSAAARRGGTKWLLIAGIAFLAAGMLSILSAIAAGDAQSGFLRGGGFTVLGIVLIARARRLRRISRFMTEEGD